MNGIPWTKAEEARLIELYPDAPMSEMKLVFNRTETQIQNKAHHLHIHRSKAYMQSLARNSNLAISGEAFRFKHGITPWNKGTNYTAGGRSAETRFKPGQRSANYKPVGTLRVNTDGYVDLKVADGIRQWKLFHRIIWERLRGPIPKGMVIIFRDKNPLNLSITNFEMVTKRENMQRNSVHRYGTDIAKISQLKAAISRQINKRERNQDAGHQPTV